MYRSLCLFLTVMPSLGQFQFHRDFFASIDQPIDRVMNSDFVPTDERIRQLDEKLSTRFAQQISYLRERMEALEKTVQDMRRANTYDWNASDSGSLYKVFATPKSWEDAQNVCKTFNAHLAVIDSEHKNKYVQDLLSKEDSSKKSSEKAAVEENKESPELWIGLKTKAEMSSPNSRYANFYDEEKVDGCAVIDAQGKWKIRPCNSEHGFICQQITVR